MLRVNACFQVLKNPQYLRNNCLENKWQTNDSVIQSIGEGVGGRGENYARGIHDIRRHFTKFPAKIAPSAGTSSMLSNLKLHKLLLNKTTTH